MNRIEVAEVSLLVIAKAPVPGRAKTRLIPDLGEAGAAALAAACLGDTLEAVAAAPAARRILALDGEPGEWLPEGAGFEIVAQREGGLDARLAGAFADSGAAPAMLVGMDTPQITPELLASGTARLAADGNEAVIGAADDGGWWAIGLRAQDPRVFDGVPMSADDTGAHQRARMRELGLRWSELEVLTDIDTIDDARTVAAAAPATRCAAELRRLEAAAR